MSKNQPQKPAQQPAKPLKGAHIDNRGERGAIVILNDRLAINESQKPSTTHETTDTVQPPPPKE